MDKNKILEVVYKTINESIEWGIECEDKIYGFWINGVVSLANNLFEEVKKDEYKSET